MGGNALVYPMRFADFFSGWVDRFNEIIHEKLQQYGQYEGRVFRSRDAKPPGSYQPAHIVWNNVGAVESMVVPYHPNYRLGGFSNTLLRMVNSYIQRDGAPVPRRNQWEEAGKYDGEGNSRRGQVDRGYGRRGNPPGRQRNRRRGNPFANPY